MNTNNPFHEMALRLFGDVVTPAVLELAESGALPPELWAAIGDSGMGLAMVAEEQGGIGASLTEVATMLLAAGEHAVPGPLLELFFGNHLLSLAGIEPVVGPLALALVDGPERSGSFSEVRNVAWVNAASHLVVLARSGAEGARVALMPTSQLVWSAEVTDVSGEPTARVQWPMNMPWKPVSALDFNACLRRAALLRGAQMMGAMRWCLERTTAYTQERKQFGREIGKFQVVQQMVAELAAAVVASQAILDAAIASPDEARMVAAARSRLGDSADTVFALSHQIHGAIGFSYEYVLHFRTRRLLAWRDQFGTVAHWRRVLAGSFSGRSADEFWPLIGGA